MNLIKSIDEKQVKEYMEIILKAGTEDTFHCNNVTEQIDTLGLIVDNLLKNNENGVYNKLIGFCFHVGKSLRQLELMEKFKKDE